MSEIKPKLKLGPHAVGYMKVSIENIVTTQLFPINIGELFITIGSKTTDQLKVVFDKRFAQPSIFEVFAACPSDDLILRLQGDDRVAFCKFPLSKLCQIPKVRHCLEVELIDKGKFQKQKTIEVLATAEIQVLYLVGKIGILEFLMIQAKLERDTEVMGKMDPYIRLQVDGKEFKTGVRNNEGVHPVWNSRFRIPIVSVHAELKVQVMDEDLTSDDLVGERKINLLEEGFLRPNKQLRGHPIYVYYDKKVAGVVQLEFRFLLDEF